MTTTLVLPTEFGYVIGVGVISAFVLQYLGFKVGGARTKFGVPLPSAYADQAAAAQDKQKEVFNCYQRAHQNALETYPVFLFNLLIGGFKHPLISSVCGLIWCVGRISYAHGYYTGNPSNRSKGSYQYIGMIGLLGCTISTALTILKLI